MRLSALSAVGATVALLAVRLVTSEPAWAEHAASAAERTAAGKQLAQRALDWLHRGEDAATKHARLAAYRRGAELAQRAIAADPTNADAHFAAFANKGRILLLEGATVNLLNLLRLNRELDRTLELNPNHVDALAARGGMYRQLPWLLGGDLNKAARYLSRAVALDPQAVGARIELAEAYRDMGHPERSVPLLEKAARLAQNMGKARQLAQARGLLRALTSKRQPDLSSPNN
ncbi:MAG: tetratricopeptide repeat protein [Candidatus Binatia bacterium]